LNIQNTGYRVRQGPQVDKRESTAENEGKVRYKKVFEIKKKCAAQGIRKQLGSLKSSGNSVTLPGGNTKRFREGCAVKGLLKEEDFIVP